MKTLTMGTGGEVQLPEEVRERYGLVPQTSLRLVETSGGILLVPQNGAPISAELVRELEEWQALGAESWGSFPYEDTEP